MKSEPTAEHRWLQQLVGEWEFSTEASMGPDQPPTTFAGREVVRPLGEVWVRCEGKSNSPEGSGETVLTLGFDPAAGRFVGTFVASMMAYQWVYAGTLEAGERVLTLETTGPSFTEPGGLTPYRDVIELTGEDTRTLTSHLRSAGGTWQPFMVMRYRRVG